MTTTTTAPPFDCASCARRIGKTRLHYLVEGQVWCLKCFSPHTGSRPTHARVYPDCPHAWHDMYDHPSISGTRAGMAWHLGLWGKGPKPARSDVTT